MLLLQLLVRFLMLNTYLLDQLHLPWPPLHLLLLLGLEKLQCIPPTSLMQSLVSFIPKPGKGLDILEQRPLQLVELILREVDSIIMARLARGMRLKSLLPECAYGSYPGRSTAQIIAAVTSAMAAASTTGRLARGWDACTFLLFL